MWNGNFQIRKLKWFYFKWTKDLLNGNARENEKDAVTIYKTKTNDLNDMSNVINLNLK